MNIRVLCKAYQAIELPAFLRVIAQSRIGQDRERILVLPHLFALPIGRYHRSGGPGSSKSGHFCGAHMSIAQHMHGSLRIDNKHTIIAALDPQAR